MGRGPWVVGRGTLKVQGILDPGPRSAVGRGGTRASSQPLGTLWVDVASSVHRTLYAVQDSIANLQVDEYDYAAGDRQRKVRKCGAPADAGLSSP